MLVIRNKADIKIEYPIEKIANKDKVLFFDIETTGFSRKNCIVYLIGCMYYAGNELCYTQWLAENFNDEANVLMAFHKFVQSFDTIIHFNGNAFDMPFVKERGEKYKLNFDFDNFKSVDIYKPVSKLNHILNMEDQKQKSFEKLLGIKRQDPFSGGDLIEVFKQYVESKDERLLIPLLLHNKEDVFYMGKLLSLLSISDIFLGKYNVRNYRFNEFTDLNGDKSKELCIELDLNSSLPTKLSYNLEGVHFNGDGNLAHISVSLVNGTYKYFYNNYQDYYFLPLEDKAVHKSLAKFVDNKHKKKATASTCYEKVTSEFLPLFDFKNEFFTKYLLNEFKDKTGYIKADTLNNNNIKEYTTMILKFIEKKH